MASRSKGASLLQFIVTFLLLYVGIQLGLQTFFPDQFGPQSELTGVFLRVQDDTVKGGHDPVFSVANKTNNDIELENRCPMPPVEVYRITDDGPEQLQTEETALPCDPITVLPAQTTVDIDMAPWRYSLFSEYGQYKAVLPIGTGALVGTSLEDEGAEEALSVRFGKHEAGPVTRMFRTFVTKPLLNALIFIAKYVPEHDLGMAIIILTLIVKLILFFPTQHAMEGQKKLQQVQPQLDAIRKKHKDDPEKMNKEIMALWKREGVNPMQSCLPTLIQFPVLIGLFFVIRDGSILELSEHLIYPMFSDLGWTWDMNFLGLDLSRPSRFIFPPFLVVMQFLQMKLTFAMAQKKKEKDGKDDKKTDAQAIQQRMMLYGLPILIGVFAFQFPAAVALYWAVSTVFAIGQQIVVNRKS